MKKHIKTIQRSIIFCMIVMFVCPNLLPSIDNRIAADESAGVRLLDRLVMGFKTMAEAGAGNYEQVNMFLQDAMAGLKKAKKDNQVNAVFYMRYKRLLTIMKLAVIDTPYDPEGILDDFILREINTFIESVTGIRSEREHRGIGAIAGAIAEEILNLHIYLDSKSDRAALIKKYKLR
jgi:hypothetical protein